MVITELLLPFNGHYIVQRVLADTASQELEDFVGAKFYYSHAIAYPSSLFGLWRRCYSFLSGVTYIVSISLTSSLLLAGHSHDVQVVFDSHPCCPIEV